MSVSLSEHLPLLAEAPDGIKKLRGLILELAVRGKLVPQDPSDESASELLKRIAAEKARLVAERKIRKDKPLVAAGEYEKWPFALPNGWRWSRVGDLSSVVRGVSYDKSQASDAQLSGYLPLLRGHNINQRLNFEDLVFVPAKLISEDQLIRRGDIVIAMSSGSAHLVGKAAQSVENVEYGFGAFCGLIRAHSEELHRYFGFFFQTPFYRNRVAGHGKGIGINNLQKGALLALECPVPPLPEQHRIVDKVDELMALCDRMEAEQTDAEAAHATLVQTLLGTLTQSRDAAELAANWHRLSQHFDTFFTTESSLDALKQTILQLAVMGKLVPQDPNDEPASELLKRIAAEKARLVAEGKIRKDKPLPEISEDEKPFALPARWGWVRLADLLPEFQNGVSSRGDAGGEQVIVLRLADIKDGVVSLADTRQLLIDPSSISKYHLEKGDILIIRVNGSAEIVGRFVVVEDVPKVIYCDHFIRLRVSQAFFSPRFLSLVAASRLVRDKIKDLFITTAGQKTVNQGHIGSLAIPLVSLAEQHRIVAKVDELMALCVSLKTDLAKSRARQARLASTLIESALQAA